VLLVEDASSIVTAGDVPDLVPAPLELGCLLACNGSITVNKKDG
jgi:hypothetical protein